MSILHDALKRLDKKGQKKAPDSSADQPTIPSSDIDRDAVTEATALSSTLVDAELEQPTELEVTALGAQNGDRAAPTQPMEELEMSSTRRDVRLDELTGMGETLIMGESSYHGERTTFADKLSENSFALLALVLLLMSVGVMVYYFTSGSSFDAYEQSTDGVDVVKTQPSVVSPPPLVVDRPDTETVPPAAPKVTLKQDEPVEETTTKADEPKVSEEPRSVARLTEGTDETPGVLVVAEDVGQVADVSTVDAEPSVQPSDEPTNESVGILTATTDVAPASGGAPLATEREALSQLTKTPAKAVERSVEEDVALLTRGAGQPRPTSDVAAPANKVAQSEPAPAKPRSDQVAGTVDRINQSLAFSDKGQLSEQKYHLRHAYEMYRNAYKADPSNPQFLTDLGRVTAKLEQYDDSRRWISRVSASERNWEHAFWLGFGYLNEGKPELAVEYFEEAAREDGQQAASWLYLGLTQQQLGQFNQSIDSFHAARAVSPGLPEIAYNTGISWLALGQKPKARAAFEHFLKVTDQNPSYYVNQRERVVRQYLR